MTDQATQDAPTNAQPRPAVAGQVERSVRRPDEEWRDVPGFEGVYRVSSLGRVLSLERRCDCGGRTRRVRQRLLKQTVQKQRGRPETCIVKLSRPNEAGEYSSVGRLVLRAFVREPSGNEIAHFKDGDPTNASLANMEWSTFSGVAVYRGYRPPCKRKAPNTELTCRPGLPGLSGRTTG